MGPHRPALSQAQQAQSRQWGHKGKIKLYINIENLKTPRYPKTNWLTQKEGLLGHLLDPTTSPNTSRILWIHSHRLSWVPSLMVTITTLESNLMVTECYHRQLLPSVNKNFHVQYTGTKSLDGILTLYLTQFPDLRCFLPSR